MKPINTFTIVNKRKNPMNPEPVKKKVFVESYDDVNDQFIVNWNWSQPFKDVINKHEDVYEQLIKLFPPDDENQMRLDL